MTKERVLFICTHNSARSQMAEALLRQRYSDRFEAASAGTEPSRVHPLALRALAELGIDASAQHSKGLDAVDGQRFDVTITVCNAAREACPVLPGAARQLHWDLPDPSQAEGDEAGRLAAFRAVRDEIARLLEETFGRR
jgi:arsenate reductase